MTLTKVFVFGGVIHEPPAPGSVAGDAFAKAVRALMRELIHSWREDVGLEGLSFREFPFCLAPLPRKGGGKCL